VWIPIALLNDLVTEIEWQVHEVDDAFFLGEQGMTIPGNNMVWYNSYQILSLDHIPARIPASDRFETWQRELTAYLSDLSERSWSETEEDTLGSIPVENVSPSMQIAFYIATDRSPNKFFQMLSGGEPFRSVKQKTKLNPANTLIGVISFEGDNS
jgi:hypothetical protein